MTLETGRLSVDRNASISVSDLSGVRGAGSLQIAANSIQLDRGGSLTAETRAGTQGNILLNTSNLQMRRQSLIQTNAFGAAQGGNIEIGTNTLVALENSDITANARDAFGGRVRITAQGIFGTAFRPNITPESDITASSDLGAEFSGVVEIKTPDIDPSRGLIARALYPVDAGKLILQRCLADRKGNEFIITGRGGIVPSPDRSSSGNRLLENLGRVDGVIRTDKSIETERSSLSQANTNIAFTEARSWAIAPDGGIVLVGSAAPFAMYGCQNPHRLGGERFD